MSEVSERVITGAVVPNPLSGSTAGMGEFDEMARADDSLPAAVGMKRTESVQLWPTGKV